MENPPDPRPVFEADQVVTFLDIMGIRGGYELQYSRLPWYEIRRRFMMKVAVGVCSEMLHWLAHGKPPNGVNCRGGHNNGL